IDTAVNLAFIYTDDIDGLERDDHSKWDIGADEYCIYSSGIWYVDSEKYGDGTSWDTAFETIQQAVSAAGPGEEIWVKQGTYLLSSEIRIDKSVSIFGCFKGTETQREQRNCRFNENVVDGQNSFRCFGINASDVTIDGFKIQNGDHDFGGGMYASETSSFTVSSCTFTSNHANDGGGFFNEAPQGDLVNCIFQNNTAVDNGGGLYILGSSLNVANCIFSGNEAGDAYGPGGGAIFNSNSSPKITNSTFSGNTARDNTEGGAIFNRFSHPQITNCILWGNIAGYGPEIVDDEMSSSTVSYTNIDWDGFPGYNGNIRKDPLWVGPDANDFHLGPASPCIDAGTNEVPNLPGIDFEGDPRIVNEIVDMGADEFIE
ncbi:MAG: choice-of-anchor Q domain-containing protein, partial [Desulfobacteraceae bacterium]